MTRVFAAFTALALLGSAVHADALIIRKGTRLDTWGMPSKIGDKPNEIEITPDNVELYYDQSTGVIDAEGYDGITCRKTDRAKTTEFFPWSDVVRVYYAPEPESLLTGIDSMATGNWAQAIGDLRACAEDEEVRSVFRHRARYLVGICYLQSGRAKDAIAHFKAWPPINSRYTPEVYRILAELYTELRQYPAARAQYDEVAKLDKITDDWKFKARLGAVKVDIAERKFAEGEQMAKRIAQETQGRADIVNAHALALVLQADAIFKSGNADRLPEAQSLLERGQKLEGPAPETRAFLLVTLGHALYAQGKLEEARFPYLRAALMYPDSGYDGTAYHNAGQCYIDMSGRLEATDQAKSDEYLVKGMKLLGTAAGRYRNPEAGKVYREHKKRYDAIVAKEGGEAAGEGESDE